jgi:hypothetical protein
MMLIGLPLSYFLIAPENKMGLNAGASGLAIKMVVVQFIAVNVQLYFNSKYLKLNFLRYLGHQFFSVFFLLIISFIVMLYLDNILIFNNHIVFTFILSGLIYSIIVFALVCFCPVLFGIYKEDILKIRKFLRV